jgi:hypothetical protein
MVLACLSCKTGFALAIQGGVEPPHSKGTSRRGNESSQLPIGAVAPVAAATLGVREPSSRLSPRPRRRSDPAWIELSTARATTSYFLKNHKPRPPSSMVRNTR